jgi:TolB-like protein/DNA-binding winged helix-turn-helix (wHTH) protein
MSEGHREPLLRFGDFTIDASARTLHKFGRRLKLHRQPFEILLLLIARPGVVVTRDELQAKLWPKDTFVDFENSLNSAVKKLRQVMGDSASSPRFIETVPRVGYRFIAQVQVQSSSLTSPASEAVSPEAALPSARFPRFLARKKWLIGAATCFVILVVAAAAFLNFRSHGRAVPVESRTMLAVLPFENLTGDATQDYLSDGLTEEMIAQLEQAAPQQFGVIAPASVMEYKDSSGNLDEIARRLGVEYVLEGGLRRDSQRVRISTQLIRAQDRKVVWARQYDRELTSLLALQTEIAQEISDEVQLTLGRRANPPAFAQGTSTASVPYEAYDLYLKGRYFLNSRNTLTFPQAIEYFQQAIAKDPNYARAYAALADSYALTSSYYLSPPQDIMPKARAAALKALQLDNSLAEAHTSLALITENYDWDWQTADREFSRAIQLDPNYPTAHQWYAECLAWQGQFKEALAESERARQLDPLSLIIVTDHAAILYYSGQYSAAIQELRTALAITPNFGRAHGLLIFSYIAAKRFDEAAGEIEKWRRTNHSPGLLPFQAYVDYRSGKLAEARRFVAEFNQAEAQHRGDPAYLSSEVLASIAADQKDRVFAQLQQAFQQRSNTLTGLKVDPLYDPFRSDPRFQDLLRRVGLAN